MSESMIESNFMPSQAPFYDPRSPRYFPRAYTEEQMNYLQSGGRLYSFSMEWSDTPHSRSSLSTECFYTREEADAAGAESLAVMGYKLPRWWQWWRWGEGRPSANVIALLKDNGR